MKKTGILNSHLSRLIGELGHTDRILIADAGFPIPPGVERIDLAVRPGLPPFLEVVEAVLTELAVEKALVAEEMRQQSPALYPRLRALLGDVPIEAVPHAALKAEANRVRAIVRTGEFTPYANVILQAGVVF
ncbi:MAG: D-ribose pyranase [Hydrogenibacillus schlegelii]|nr:D-ribose pyranase [Hydrogenibacillus schlegelii]